MSGHDQCYALPELQQWETAKVDNYVWGDPAAIGAYGKALDTAGTDLGTIADSLGGMNVADFWTGPAATAFTELKGRLTPAVRGLSTMQKDAATALDTWQRHLSVYQEDCGTAISTGKQGWHLYQTTSCDNTDAQNKMTSGKTGITTAQTSSMSSGRTCKSQLEAAATRADVSTAPPAAPAGVPHQVSTTPGQVGTAPSGQEPVPFTGPIPAGQPRPYVDPANGKIVVPRPGPWAIGKQPWDYADGSAPPGSPLPPPASTPPTTAPPATTNQPWIVSTTPGQVGSAPSGREPVPFTGPIASGQPRPWVDPANGRVVVPKPGPWAVGKQPWEYAS
jgi:hypothetical protein